MAELLVLIWRREGEQRFGFLFFLIFDSVLTFFFLAPPGTEMMESCQSNFRISLVEWQINTKIPPNILHSLQRSSVVETQTPVSNSDLTFTMMA